VLIEFSSYFLNQFYEFIIGGISLCCLWHRNFSHKCKVGILMGVTLQIFSGLIQVNLILSYLSYLSHIIILIVYFYFIFFIFEVFSLIDLQYFYLFHLLLSTYQ
jgi:hypothetical protein